MLRDWEQVQVRLDGRVGLDHHLLGRELLFKLDAVVNNYQGCLSGLLEVLGLQIRNGNVGRPEEERPSRGDSALLLIVLAIRAADSKETLIPTGQETGLLLDEIRQLSVDEKAFRKAFARSRDVQVSHATLRPNIARHLRDDDGQLELLVTRENDLTLANLDAEPSS